MEFDNIQNFNPQECFSGRFNRINRITANIFRKYISPFGLTDSQLSLLFILSKMNGLTQKQISDFAILEKSSVNRNIQRLLDKGYLTKQEVPILKITHDGKTLVNTIIPEWEKAMTEIRTLLGNEGEDAVNLIHHKLTKQ